MAMTQTNGKILKFKKGLVQNTSSMIRAKWQLYFFVVLLCLASTGSLLGQELTDETRFAKARLLYERKLFQSARAEFEQIESHDLLIESHYWSALCAVKSSQGDGEALIASFVNLYPKHPLAQNAYYQLAEYYYNTGDFERAVSSFSKARADNESERYFKLGRSHFELKQYDEALAAFGNIQDMDISYQRHAAFYIGFIAFDRQQYDKALESLEEAFDSDIYQQDAKMLYAGALYQLRKYDEVVLFLENEMTGSEHPTIMSYLADAYYELSNYELARTAFDQLLKKHAKMRTVGNYFKAGYSSFKTDNIDDAVDRLKRSAVTDDTVGAYASYYLGLIYHQQQNLAFAVNSFENTAKYETRLKEHAIYQHGRTLVELERYQDAIEVFNLYRNKYPDGQYRDGVNEMLSAAYAHTDNYDLAMSYIESLTELTTSIKKVYQRVTFIKALDLFNRKKFSQAAELFPKSLVYNVDREITQQSYYWMAETLSLLGNEKDAAFYYKSVDQSDPVLYQKSRYGLGYAYFNQKMYAEAIEAFTAFERSGAKGIKPAYLSDGLVRLADSYFATKSYQNGIDYYQKALKSGYPRKGELYFQIGLLNRYEDREEEAKKYFNKLIEEFPESHQIDHAQYQIAQIDYKLGNESAAIASYQKFLEAYPNSPFIPYALLNQAVAYDNKGESELSITNYREILERFPRHETANSALLALQGKSANGEFDQFDSYLLKYKAANPNSTALENIEFENARTNFYNQKYEVAIRLFDEFIKAYPSSALVTEAIFTKGDAYYRLEKFNEALEQFYRVEKAVDFSKHARVLYRIAEIESKLGRYNISNTYYTRLGEFEPSSRYKAFKEQGLMENYYALGRYDSAIHYGKALLSNVRIGVLVESAANLIVGSSYFSKGQYDEARLYLLPLVASSPDERGAEANYLMAKMLYLEGKNEQALESLFSMSKNFNGYEAWMGKAFLLMADVYVSSDEVFQAKATLNSLVEHSSIQSIVQQASQKLAKLESIDPNDSTGNE